MAFEAAGLPTLTITDTIMVSVIPMLLLSLYVVFTYKMLPKRSVDESKMKAVKDVEGMDKFHETVTYIVFGGVMVSLFLNSFLGDLMYIMPAVGAAILMYTKVMSQKEMQRALSKDMLFMIAGIFVMADALSASGAGVMDTHFQEIFYILGQSLMPGRVLTVHGLSQRARHP